jgi:3-oxoacyl-[acyl-carrier protein] reductase
MRHAAEHWRKESKTADGPVYGRVVNTASEAGMFGSPGQPNYASAKAAIISLTMVAANSLGRFGVNSNVIAPRARTRMTQDLAGFANAEVVDGFDPYGPEHVAPLVTYLASPAAEKVSGQLFVVHGRTISVIHGPFAEQSFEVGTQWTPDEVAAALMPFYDGRTPVAQGAQFQPDPRG